MRNGGNGAVQSDGVCADTSAPAERRHARAAAMKARRLMGDGCSGETIQRTSVTHEPHVPERIEEMALSVNAPGRVMTPQVIEAARRSSSKRTSDEGVGVIAEDLDSRGRGAENARAFPAIRGRLANEKRRARKLQARD